MTKPLRNASTKLHNSAANRHAVFIAVIEELGRYHLPLVAERSGVSYPTLWKWLYSDVANPHTRTLFAVAEAMGFTVELRKVGKRPLIGLVR